MAPPPSPGSSADGTETLSAEPRLEGLLEGIAPLREALLQHRMYGLLTSKWAIQRFMELHCFAVMDFMCLLKSLQQRLTVVTVPWFPPANPRAARLINEIVVAEEADQDQAGGFVGHYDMYIQAMDQLGASTTSVETLVELIRNRQHYRRAMLKAGVPDPAQRFVKATMESCLTGKTHEVAAFFVFGRENLIPEMFRQIIATLHEQGETGLGGLIYYLDRHIDIDDNVHGPASLRMISDLCGDQPRRWDQAQRAAQRALEERLRLWDAINTAIESGPEH